ncbi:MAG: YkgJ family cysteine cluster protein [Candidatus Korobacteraceae bacterium]
MRTEGSANETLREEVAEGLLYAHSRANANTGKLLEVASFSYALMELLMERGIITVEELDARKSAMNERLVAKFSEKGMGVALTTINGDKYAFQSTVQIDCENRIPLCRAACCRLGFALSRQDVEEGHVKWELGHPYMIRRGADGYCHHLDRGRMGCGIYDHRPVVCRGYDCRKDARIWADFEHQVVSPDLEKLFPVQEEVSPQALVQITTVPEPVMANV